MLNFDLQNHRPLREIVYEELKRQILVGEISPGTRMMEVELADVMGVSRTPVREAIRKLEKEGLVSIEPRKGAYASNISIKDMVDVLEVRQGLEEMAAMLAAGRITESQKEELLGILANYRIAVEAANIEEIINCNFLCNRINLICCSFLGLSCFLFSSLLNRFHLCVKLGQKLFRVDSCEQRNGRINLCACNISAECRKCFKAANIGIDLL